LNRPTIGLIAIAVLALASSAISIAQTTPGPATTAAPAPAPSGVTPTTIPPTPAPPARRGRGSSTPAPGSSATDAPEPPQFATMDGVWEVQMQPPLADRAIYSHLYVTQKADQLTGTWRRDPKTNLTFAGTFDGRLFKLSITDGTKTYTMAGYAENFGDMVGLYSDGDPKHDTPFTASHRKKEKLGASI
jgi:hypothetical protein